MPKLHKSCLPLFWFFVLFYWSLPLIMSVIADLNGLESVGNKCWGVIDFNDLLPIGPLVTPLLVRCVDRYSCHLWKTHLMFVVILYRYSFFSSSSIQGTRVIFLLFKEYEILHWACRGCDTVCTYQKNSVLYHKCYHCFIIYNSGGWGHGFFVDHSMTTTFEPGNFLKLIAN